jgi:hypothetical protein
MSSQQQQEEYLNKLRQQIQAQTVQEIMNKMSEKCFKVRFSAVLPTSELVFFSIVVYGKEGKSFGLIGNNLYC